MQRHNDEAGSLNDESGFDSRDCIDIVCDGPWDATVRPCRAELLAFMKAEKEKVEHWMKARAQSNANE